MHKASFFSLASALTLSVGAISCSKNVDNSQLTTKPVAAASSTEANKLYSKARVLETRGQTKKATKLYGKVAGAFPTSPEAPKARLREAQLYYSSGKLIQSFEKYQFFITKYRGTNHYDEAIKRQAEVAHAASDGKINNKFLGLKSDIPRSKVEKMFNQVRENAPFGPTAPRAQFGLGQMWENAKQYNKAIAAYEELQVRYSKSSLAPEALLRVGSLLLKQTEDGNRNKGNLDTAKNTFTDLTQLYPRSKQATIARQKLREINASDIRRSFEIAEFYEKKQQLASAAFYYREVIRKTKGGSAMNKLAKQRLAKISK